MNEQPMGDKGAVAGSNTFLGIICCLCVCATIIFVVNRLTPGTPSPRRLWTPDLVQTNGDVTTMTTESRQLEFWTPSARTKDYLHKEKGQVVPTETWEVISNDEPVMQFGMLLHQNTLIMGYRRVEVWGQGRSIYKPGWWWTVNVNTNYTASDLARTYEQFWQSHAVLFVEVIDNRGSD